MFDYKHRIVAECCVYDKYVTEYEKYSGCMDYDTYADRIHSMFLNFFEFTHLKYLVTLIEFYTDLSDNYLSQIKSGNEITRVEIKPDIVTAKPLVQLTLVKYQELSSIRPYFIGKVEKEIALANKLFHSDHTQLLIEISSLGYFEDSDDSTSITVPNDSIPEIMEICKSYGHVFSSNKIFITGESKCITILIKHSASK